MGRKGIDSQLVTAAAEALSAAGERVTVPAVSARIEQETGQRPSYSTLQRILDDWKEGSSSHPAAQVPEMPERVQAAFDRAWSVAASEAQSGLDAEREALKTMQRDMEQEHRDMAAEIERLEGVLEQAGETATKLKDELAAEREAKTKAEEKATELAISNARLDEQAKAANARADDLGVQLENLQETFREAVKQPAKPRTRQRSSPKPTNG